MLPLYESLKISIFAENGDFINITLQIQKYWIFFLKFSISTKCIKSAEISADFCNYDTTTSYIVAAFAFVAFSARLRTRTFTDFAPI